MRQVVEKVQCDLCGATGYTDGDASDPTTQSITGRLTIGGNTFEFDLCVNCQSDETTDLATIVAKGAPITKKSPTPPKGTKKVGNRIDRDFKHEGEAPPPTLGTKDGNYHCQCGKKFVTERGYKKHWTQAGGLPSGNSLRVAV